jgi:hypothetical protein
MNNPIHQLGFYLPIDILERKDFTMIGEINGRHRNALISDARRLNRDASSVPSRANRVLHIGMTPSPDNDGYLYTLGFLLCDNTTSMWTGIGAGIDTKAYYAIICRNPKFDRQEEVTFTLPDIYTNEHVVVEKIDVFATSPEFEQAIEGFLDTYPADAVSWS